jgi:site-specific recombinase XerD
VPAGDAFAPQETESEDPALECRADGSLLTPSVIEAALRFARRAGLRLVRSHMLRHTFCSDLATRGAPPKAVQELAGHATLAMTLRYMHLAPAVLRQAIELLKFGQPVGNGAQAAR